MGTIESENTVKNKTLSLNHVHKLPVPNNYTPIPLKCHWDFTLTRILFQVHSLAKIKKPGNVKCGDGVARSNVFPVSA